MARKRLTTTIAVIDALGGVKTVAALTGRKYTAAHNWKSAGKFPADTYCALTRQLDALGLSAPPRLWGQDDRARSASTQA